MPESLKDLIIKRSSIKGQITKFKNYMDRVTKQTQLTAVEIAELALKISKLDGLSSKFDELQSHIELLNSEHLDSEIDERERIEQDIILCTAQAKSILDEQTELKTIEQDKRRRESLFVEARGDTAHNDFPVRLPQIQIAKFDGSYFRWLEFRDTYKSLIHDNDSIPNIQKFHYLVSYLVGDAARVISNIEL